MPERRQLMSVFSDGGPDLRGLAPGPEGAAPAHTNESSVVVGQIALVTKPDQYTVFVSIGQRDGPPQIALPLDGDDGQRRYRIGQLDLRNN